MKNSATSSSPHLYLASPLAIGLSFFILGGLVFYWLPYHHTPPSGESAPRPIQLGREGLVNPLLAYTVPENESELKPLHDSLEAKTNEEVSSGAAQEIGVYFRDLDTARWTGINPDQKFSPASLLKVPVMITYLKLAETNPGILNEPIFYDGTFEDNAREDIRPLKSIQPKSSYTVDELLKYMIAYSDNNATTLLYANADVKAFDKIYLDLKLTPPASTADFLSPRNYSLFFRILYNVTYLNKEMSQKALGWLAYSDFPQGIMAGVPEGVQVAQKFGEHDFDNGIKELHDCGVVYHAKHPYFLCVMTKGADFAKLAGVIRDISDLIYKAVDNNYTN